MHHDKLEHNYHRINYHNHDQMWKTMPHLHYPMMMKVNHHLLIYLNEIEIFVIYNFHFHSLMQIYHIQLYELDYPTVVNQFED
jgi:hypothetical protein